MKVKTPTIVSILIFISRMNDSLIKLELSIEFVISILNSLTIMLSSVEHKKTFYNFVACSQTLKTCFLVTQLKFSGTFGSSLHLSFQQSLYETALVEPWK